jgi:hypothetical protein
MNVQCMIQTLTKCVLKVERFTSDIVTLCYIDKSSRVVIDSGDQKVNFGLQNALNLTYAHLQFKIFSRGYTPGPPLKGEGKGGEGRKEGAGTGGREGQGNRGERVGKEEYGQEGRGRGG